MIHIDNHLSIFTDALSWRIGVPPYTSIHHIISIHPFHNASSTEEDFNGNPTTTSSLTFKFISVFIFMFSRVFLLPCLLFCVYVRGESVFIAEIPEGVGHTEKEEGGLNLRGGIVPLEDSSDHDAGQEVKSTLYKSESINYFFINEKQLR